MVERKGKGMLELNKIHLGNCFDLLPMIPDGSVDAVITDTKFIQPTNDATTNELDTKQGEMF